MQSNKTQEKRIDKEIFLLRNLPKEYKLGKKETQLGTLIDLEVDRSAVKSQFLDKSIERFHFDILLRDKYPFQPPIIMTRTTVSPFRFSPTFLVLLTIPCRRKRPALPDYP